MGDRIESQQDFDKFIEERQLVTRLRNAIGFCKNSLEIAPTVLYDMAL